MEGDPGGLPKTMKMLWMASKRTCGRKSSTTPWSLEKRLRMRPVGFVWKKLRGARRMWCVICAFISVAALHRNPGRHPSFDM